MKPSEVKPDSALCVILSGNVKVKNPSGTMVAIPVYSDGSQPTTGLGDDFIVVRYNGYPMSVTDKMGVWRGNLMVALYNKANSDGTARRNRIEKILAQMETLIHNATDANYRFGLEISQPITPTTVNQSSGYSSTVLNAEWHTK